ncbi:MAG: DinB family protein [Cryomorphaceae bacterium]|nr:MAG: DinB family protein [Cryomorphaceae bacterium]
MAGGRPQPKEYGEWYAGYVEAVKATDALSALQEASDALDKAMGDLGDMPGSFTYAEGKWTHAQLLQHLIDAEWIFSVRALRTARGDQTPMPGYNENDYASEPVTVDVATLLNTLQHLRSSTMALFGTFTGEVFTRTGTADWQQVSVRALAFIIAGHQLHHLKVWYERYFSLFRKIS